MSYGVTSPKKGGAWTKVFIFVSLYVLLLESLIEWVVVLYLYGNKNVDSKMAPSLIFSLIAVRLFSIYDRPETDLFSRFSPCLL